MSKKKDTGKHAIQKKELQNADMNASEVLKKTAASDTNAKFEIKYKETQDVLEKICMTYNADKVSINCRMFAVIAVPFITGLMIAYGNPGGGTSKGMVIFLLKALVIWVAAYFGGGIFGRTFGKKIAELTSAGDGEEMFEARTKRRKGEILAVCVRFGEDSFDNITKTLTKTYRYANVTRLIETDDAMALVVLQPSTGEKGLYGFPKDSFTKGDAESLKTFLEEKCKGAKKGFIKY